jgi:ATP-dependent DNA helicase RecG
MTEEKLRNILTFPEKTTREITPQVTPQATPQVKNFLLVCDGEKTSKELMREMDLKDRKYFRTNILNSSLEQELIEMTMPEKPNHPNQKYRLTEKGIILRQILEKEL